jgi:galactose mutarotase-like enzyme
VRGGIPVLFPSPGKLTDDRHPSGSMKQHGFARTLPWTVTSRADATARLVLRSGDDTRAQYPWDFTVELRFTLGERSLRIDHTVVASERNTEPMPFGFGFHPYFAVPEGEKAATTIETGATRAFDNVTKQTVPLHGIPLARGEVDLHLLDHGCSTSELSWHAGATRVRLRASSDYGRWVVWTLPGRPFVCLEPWTSPSDALNTGDGVIVLRPGDAWSGWLELLA